MGIFADMADTVMNEFGDATELVYYTPYGGTEISFTTHVFREQPREYDNIKNYGKSAVSASLDFDIMVYIPRSVVSDIGLHRDVMRIKAHVGDTAYQEFKIHRIQEEDAGAFIVRVT